MMPMSEEKESKIDLILARLANLEERVSNLEKKIQEIEEEIW